MTDPETPTTITDPQGNPYPRDLPLVPLREAVVFPKLVVPLGVGREKSVAAINAAMAEEKHYVILAAQRDAEVDDVSPEQIYGVGTVAEIVRLLPIPDGSAQIIVQGLQRVRITGYQPEQRFFRATFEPLTEDLGNAVEREALVRSVRALFEKYVDNGGSILPEVAMTAKNTEDPSHFADLVASSPDLTLEQRQQLLETRPLVERLKFLSVFLAKQNEILELKAKIQSEVQQTLDKTQREYILDEDHYGLPKVKGRIIEDMAVRKLSQNLRAPILCFVGPPGVGKTSLGKSIARAMGRKFIRMSLGGIRDEAEIRGHRRTYVGALPGRILQNMKTAGEINPVFMLDEIDKVGADFRGDPSSALLEVLDPEQNNAFSDHYLEVPYDLSKVIFITTANVEDTIIPPLRDRTEIIRLPGYTEDEKMHIATGFLMPKQLKQHGLEDGRLTIEAETLRKLVREYTREAGVRNLEREIGTICRKVARAIAEAKTEAVTVKPEDLKTYLGPERFEYGLAEKEDQVGAATGVSVSEHGGDVLTVEATIMDQGSKQEEFVLTGQIQKVMEESAIAALSYVRAHYAELGVPKGFFKDHAMHIHVPAGAIPKDGPSAGVTMATAIVSALTGRKVRKDVAMTGEITLRGHVLPIGGVKEKLLAAHRAGIKGFLMPKKNKKDLVDVPEEGIDTVDIKLVESIDEVLKAALLT